MSAKNTKREKASVALRVAVAAAIIVPQLLAAEVNDWPSHDHDAGAQRFSPLKQITPSNVARLQTAWTFDTGATWDPGHAVGDQRHHASRPARTSSRSSRKPRK
jgi:glucose dehydrogenase